MPCVPPCWRPRRWRPRWWPTPRRKKKNHRRCPGPGGADPCRRPGRGGCPGPAAPAGDPGFLGEAGNGPERDGGLHPAQPGPVRPAAGVSGFPAGAQCPGAGGPGAGERGGDPARPGGERRARGGRGACSPGGGPQPESAAEPEPQPEFQEKKEEESPFPLDFKLNLEDLQFGRNYNGGDRR